MMATEELLKAKALMHTEEGTTMVAGTAATAEADMAEEVEVATEEVATADLEDMAELEGMEVEVPIMVVEVPIMAAVQTTEVALHNKVVRDHQLLV